MEYYCHSCGNVISISANGATSNTALRCPLCTSEFVELLAAEDFAPDRHLLLGMDEAGDYDSGDTTTTISSRRGRTSRGGGKFCCYFAHV